MEPHEAATLLGLTIGADQREVRRAYLRCIRSRHPDIAGPAATADAARINEAYVVMSVIGEARSNRVTTTRQTEVSRPRTANSSNSRSSEPHEGDTVTLVDDETVGFTFPAEQVFALLVEVSDDLGSVTYVDANAGLLEAHMQFEGFPRCSVMVTLQGGTTVEALCTVESLEPGTPPPVGEVVALLAAALRQRLSR